MVVGAPLDYEHPEDRDCDFELWVPGILAQKRELPCGELASEGQISKSRESKNFSVADSKDKVAQLGQEILQ